MYIHKIEALKAFLREIEDTTINVGGIPKTLRSIATDREHWTLQGAYNESPVFAVVSTEKCI